jgi:hypothetical protein
MYKDVLRKLASNNKSLRIAKKVLTKESLIEAISMQP